MIIGADPIEDMFNVLDKSVSANDTPVRLEGQHSPSP